jgi:hypothetical protein
MNQPRLHRTLVVIAKVTPTHVTVRIPGNGHPYKFKLTRDWFSQEAQQRIDQLPELPYYLFARTTLVATGPEDLVLEDYEWDVNQNPPKLTKY